jgi:hypothetical protein
MAAEEISMRELNEEQRPALDATAEIPARVMDPVTGRVGLLLKGSDFDRIRGMVPDAPDAPRLWDARTGASYALVPEDRYERYKAFFEEDPLTSAERQALLREAGKRAGWDDPAWDETGAP